ncbi:MAG: hypothetical protein RKL32_03370 [Gammaproteobacteria bacterium]
MNRVFDADSGIEAISAGGHEDVSIVGTGANDQLDFSAVKLDGITSIDGGQGHDRITGSAGDDVIRGGEHNDVLDGGDGNDFLDGGSGNDILRGGEGDDLFVFAAGDGHDQVDGGAGWADVLQLSGDPGNDGELPWSIEINGEDVAIELADKALDIDAGASGLVTFEDGSSIAFEGIERIEW